jgi:hypothetical protein
LPDDFDEEPSESFVRRLRSDRSDRTARLEERRSFELEAP